MNAHVAMTYPVTIADGPGAVVIIIWTSCELLVALDKLSCCLIDAIGGIGRGNERRKDEYYLEMHAEVFDSSG